MATQAICDTHVAVDHHACASGDAVAPVAPSARHRFDLSASHSLTRAQAIAATLAQALDDQRFRDAAAAGDAARDSGDWASAEHGYAAALAHYPLHWGYAIQYAHVVKEQGRHGRAELWYRSAVALGAPPAMVDQHLAFVARLNGADFIRQGMPDLAVPPLRAPPTFHDITLLAELAGVPGVASTRCAIDFMRRLPDNRAVLLQMIAMPQFAQANRTLLDIIGRDINARGHG